MELTAIQGSTEGIPSEHLHAITLWDLQGKHIPIQELHAACELAGIPKDEWPVPDSAEVVMGRAQRKVKGELGSAHRTVQFTAKFTKQLLIDQVPHLGYKLTIVRHIEPSDSDEAVDTEDEGTAQIGGSEIVTAAIYGNNCAAKLFNCRNCAIEGFTIPKVLRTYNGNTNGFPVKGQVPIRERRGRKAHRACKSRN